MPHLEIPFAIGEPIWHAAADWHDERETCPDCAGTKTVRMICGNGDEHVLKCETCSRGYHPATGYLVRKVCRFTPRRFVPLRVDTSMGTIRYSEAEPEATCYTIADVGDLFAAKEEAEARCEEKRAEAQKEEDRRLLANITRKRRNAAWHVTHWRREVRELKKKLARAEQQLLEESDA